MDRDVERMEGVGDEEIQVGTETREDEDIETEMPDEIPGRSIRDEIGDMVDSDHDVRLLQYSSLRGSAQKRARI